MASVPALVTVDNFDGSMIPGTYVSYSFVASQSDNCMTVPIAAVMYVSFANVTLPDTLDAAPPEGGDGMTDGEMLPEDGMPDGEMLPEDGMIDGEMLPAEGGEMMSDGSVAVPQRTSGGAFAKPLMSVAIPDGGVTVDGGGSMGGSMGGTGDESTGTIVFVKADKPPVNAILEPDPAWECPEGFWAVPVEVGLADTTRVEIKRGLNVGDEVYIGRETQSADSWS